MNSSRVKLRQISHLARRKEMEVLTATEDFQEATSQVNNAERRLTELSEYISSVRSEMLSQNRGKPFNPSLHLANLDQWSSLQDELAICKQALQDRQAEYKKAQMSLYKAQAELKVMSKAEKEEGKKLSSLDSRTEWFDRAHRIQSQGGH